RISVGPPPQPDREAAEAWGLIKDSNQGPELETFIAHYKGTYYAELARLRIQALSSVDTGSVNARAEGDIVYVKVATFNEQTHANLVKTIDGLKKALKSVRGYVIDLRDNPGGLLEQAIAVSDDFLESGSIVLTKIGLEEKRANARPGDITDGRRIVVLV